MGMVSHCIDLLQVSLSWVQCPLPEGGVTGGVGQGLQPW